jgi:hypothetical protein
VQHLVTLQSVSEKERASLSVCLSVCRLSTNYPKL